MWVLSLTIIGNNYLALRITVKRLIMTYDIYFNDNEYSNNNGFRMTLKEAKDYIEMHNGTDWSYFADYKGGMVSIVCNETGKEVYSEEIK